MFPADVEKPPPPFSSQTTLANPRAFPPDVEKPLPAVVALPLRPSLLDRWNALYNRVFPAPFYTPLRIPRRLFAAAVGVFALFVLLLIVILPATLSKKSGSGSVSLPTGAETFTGDGTYYNPALGACGKDNTDNDMIVAIAWQLFDSFQTGSDPNQNPVCGRKIRAVRKGMSQGVEVAVVDRCTGCVPTDLDFSPKAFKMLGDEAEGRFLIEWAWVS